LKNIFSQTKIFQMTDKNKAAEIARNLGVNTLYANDKGEFFTQKNLAMNSVGSDAKKVEEFKFSKAEAETPEATEVEETETKSAPAKKPAARK